MLLFSFMLSLGNGFIQLLLSKDEKNLASRYPNALDVPGSAEYFELLILFVFSSNWTELI